ncbi:MAG: ribonuclease domain-containing protein [Butyricicoccaceae bacterium]
MKRKTFTARLPRLLCLLLAAAMSFALFTGCAPTAPAPDGLTSGQIGESSGPADENEAEGGAEQAAEDAAPDPDGPADGADEIDADGVFTSKEDVAAYLWAFGELPQNFITKRQARDLGWEGGSLEPYAPGKCIGGDTFGNREGRLPPGEYRECDIDTLGAGQRGAKRLVYTSDVSRIYYTEDHYESFTLLYGEEEEER